MVTFAEVNDFPPLRKAEWHLNIELCANAWYDECYTDDVDTIFVQVFEGMEHPELDPLIKNGYMGFKVKMEISDFGFAGC